MMTVMVLCQPVVPMTSRYPLALPTSAICYAE